MKNLFNIENVYKALVIILLSCYGILSPKRFQVSGSVGYGSDYISPEGNPKQKEIVLASWGPELDAGKGIHAGVLASEAPMLAVMLTEKLDTYVGWAVQSAMTLVLTLAMSTMHIVVMDP